MTDSTGLFYAYAKNINDDWSYRYLITFASRNVADTWFRAVTDSVTAGYARFAAVTRVTPQFYTHNPSVGNIPDTLTDPRVAQSLIGKVFFTLLNDRDGRILSIIPVLNYANHTSGAKFYIRSASQSDTYWYFDKAYDTVFASRERRTRFTISLADTTKPAGTVMIGSDSILISANGIDIGVSNTRDQLTYSENTFPFKFSSFNEDFQIDFNDWRTTSGRGAPIAQNPNGGERWELV